MIREDGCNDAACQYVLKRNEQRESVVPDGRMFMKRLSNTALYNASSNALSWAGLFSGGAGGGVGMGIGRWALLG